jgi:protein-tyrosine phosphatase
MQVKIFWVNDDELGRIGIMPRPRGGDWLEDEVCSLRNSGVDVIVSLLEEQEATELELEPEQSICEAQGLQYISFPIPDRDVPLSRQETERLIGKLLEFAAEGKSIVIHCRQGVGRSALIAACILAERGMSVVDAFERIRGARGCPVPDTQDQRVWVEEYAFGKLRAV